MLLLQHLLVKLQGMLHQISELVSFQATLFGDGDRGVVGVATVGHAVVLARGLGGVLDAATVDFVTKHHILQTSKK